MKSWTLIVFFAIPFVLKAQVISTFAGGGSGGSGSIATNAFIYDPVGGVFDMYGNYFFAEALGYKVGKISNTGIYTAIAGNGSAGFSGDSGLATAAMLNEPAAIKLDPAGNIYVCDGANNRIRKIEATTGIITTIAGNDTAGYGGDNGLAALAKFNGPVDICFDKKGNFYIADRFNARIRKVDTLGIITTFAGTGGGYYSGDNGPATMAQIGTPMGLAMDDTGNLYMAGSSLGSNVVRKINPAGIITTVAGVNGMYTYPGDGIAATNAPMSPVKIAIDPYGQLIIADNLNYKVFRVNNEGIIYTIAGNGTTSFSGDGGLATAAGIYIPGGVSIDSCGNLYITDINTNRIRKVSFNPACAPLTVPEVPQNQITICPNPAYSELNIDGVTAETKYALFNVTGNIEQSGILKKGNNTIAVQVLPAGIYILELIDDTGGRTVKKIIKE